ncbi:MAG TPA: DUF58 domain-containing protein [Thermoplasmata archaeon]|nr:DUF58 domain-containing protein [Thermoplasmata archaeon]
MIRRRGYYAALASAAAVLLALWTLNGLVLLLAIGLFAFLASELFLFELSGRLDPSDFWVEEVESSPRLPIGAEAPVRLRVAYHGSARVEAMVTDTRPAAIEVVEGATSTSRLWNPGDVVDIAYRIRTPRRGRQELGPVIAGREGPLGLAFEEVEIAPARPLFVTASNPALRSSPSGLALYTRVRGRLALRHRGYGSEFRSLRAYELSDDIRHVAWRRSTPENLLVREFEQESRQDYLLVYDVSPPMDVGADRASALDRAAEAGAVVVGFIERGAEDRVGLLTYSDRVHQYLKPGRGAAHFRRVADNLALLATRPGKFDLAKLLEEARRRLSVNTHLLVFTTLSEPLGELHGTHARFLGRGHHLYLFAAEPAGFYPSPDDPGDSAVLDWARRVDDRRLSRRLSLLAAEGIPTYRYDQRGATMKVVAAYGEIRAWGRTG